jgi:hypothetical protein
VLDRAPVGETELDLSIDVWYNPDMKKSWLANQHIILPYTSNLFSALRDRLWAYAFLWLLLIVVWYLMYVLPKKYKALVARNTPQA